VGGDIFPIHTLQSVIIGLVENLRGWNEVGSMHIYSVIIIEGVLYEPKSE